MNESMEELAFMRKGLKLYQAGLPDFPRNFTRDSIISALLCGSASMLRDQLQFCAELQGTKKDPLTGEEPGKIFHEYPGYRLRGLYSTYNACDTTALFLIGHDYYQRMMQDSSLIRHQQSHIEEAVNYVLNHIDKSGFFIEDPAYSLAHKYALSVTYWKDSTLVGRKKGEPAYPVTYSLAHIQNLCALRCIDKHISEDLSGHINHMQDALAGLFDQETRNFFQAVDRKGPVRTVSSDGLHALYYLETDDLSDAELQTIESRIPELVTQYGYLALSSAHWKRVQDTYHARTIWPFEQALIADGAQRFGLDEVVHTARRVISFLDTAPEIVEYKDGTFQKAGNDPQLWTIAAKEYFSQQ